MVKKGLQPLLSLKNSVLLDCMRLSSLKFTLILSKNRYFIIWKQVWNPCFLSLLTSALTVDRGKMLNPYSCEWICFYFDQTASSTFTGDSLQLPTDQWTNLYPELIPWASLAISWILPPCPRAMPCLSSDTESRLRLFTVVDESAGGFSSSSSTVVTWNCRVSCLAIE